MEVTEKLWRSDDGDDEIHGRSKGLHDGLCVQCAGMRVHALNLEEDRADSMAWARSLLKSRGFCVLDSETTGLKPPVQFVEIAIVDANGRTLFKGTVRPDCRIEPGATRIHGHTAKSLTASPAFWEVYPDFLEILWGRRVVVYNAPYDRRVWDGEVRSLGARGSIATLLDIFLVRIPVDTLFLGKLQKGSPLTKWIKENSEPIHEHFLSRFEGAAKVPYDDSVGKLVDGLSPKVHRLMSPGHDPILGFIFGVIDIMSGTGTFIDKHGNIRRVGKEVDPEGLIIAFLKVFLHLLSDLCTSAGIQPPFFTLLQLIKTKSPFVLGPSGEKVSWTNVARYMYRHGYDLRHFATMGLVPATVEMIIRGWWLCQGFENRDEAELARVKLTSMLLLGHGIAASGNLLKTGAIYSMNPLALNWAEMLALFPVMMSWMRETLKRERVIRDKLDTEWMSMYRASFGHSADTRNNASRYR